MSTHHRERHKREEVAKEEIKRVWLAGKLPGCSVLPAPAAVGPGQ